MTVLLFLRLLAGCYVAMAQAWLALLDGVVTPAERWAIVKALLLFECRVVGVSREAVEKILEG